MDTKLEDVLQYTEAYPNRFVGVAGYNPFRIKESLKEITRTSQLWSRGLIFEGRGPRELHEHATGLPRRAEACSLRREIGGNQTALTTGRVDYGRHTTAAFGGYRAAVRPPRPLGTVLMIFGSLPPRSIL